MSFLFDFLFTRMALGAALIFTPWLLARLLLGERDSNLHFLLWGPLLVGLNCTVPMLMQITHTPITPFFLAVGHLSVLAAILALRPLLKTPWLPATTDLDPRWIALAGVMALILLPFTHLAGIDTYKWQDLATAVAVEQSIPWLTHPLALFGYAPRSYPSAYPLLLATLQMLGGTGVDWGFYLISTVTALIALGTSWALGRVLWPQRRQAFLFTLFYLLAPVFIRYTHWATGRGLFMALFPGFLWFCLGPARGPRRWIGLAGMALLLLLSHKVSLAAIPLTLILFGGFKFPNPPRSRPVLLILGIGILGLGWLLTGAESSLTAGLRPLRNLAVRFGILGVLLIPGILALRKFPLPPADRFLFWGLVLTLPLACAGEMYGALPALPFVAWSAVRGYGCIDVLPGRIRGILQSSALALLALGAGAILLERSLHAMPRRLYDAAQFLEQLDPRGPFRIEAPGMARRQIQAYVSGCPRFTSPSPLKTQAALQQRPAFKGNWRSIYSEAIHYLRHWIVLDPDDFAWYGANPRIYYFQIDGEGTVPPNHLLLYEKNGVRLFGPTNSSRVNAP
jgi:hypothetical protein